MEPDPEEAERNKKIAEVYKANNYKKTDLHLKVAVKHPEIQRKHVQKFLKQDYTTQLTQTKQKEEAKGHIVATNPNEMWQFDILDLSRYVKKNDGYRYILACVDVFTRKAYVEAMKQKNADNVKTAFEEILKKANTQPESLLSDQDGAFLGGVFGEYINTKKIILNTNALRDHHALGIIDNFAFRIKNILTKGFLNDKNVMWIDKIQTIVENYNKDGTAGLGGIAPNEAHKTTLQPEEEAKEGETEEQKKQRELRNKTRMSNYQLVLNMNLEKQKANNQMSSLEVDDKVRVSTQGRSALQKGTDPKWSDDVFKVEAVKGNSIKLNNNQVYNRNDLLKVPAETETTGKNPIDKEKEAIQRLKQKLKQKVTRNKSTVKKVLATALKAKTKKKVEKKEPTIQVINVANQGGGGSSSSSSGVNNQPAAAPKAKAKPTKAEQFALMRQIALNKRNSS